MPIQNKNVVLIHLESLSATTLWQYRTQMETIWKLRRHSLSFTRFQSTATSTAMVMRSIFDGDSSSLDFARNYNDRKNVPKDWPRRLALGPLLKREGYHLILLMSNPRSPIVSQIGFRYHNISNPDIGLLMKRGSEALTISAETKTPFFLFFWDIRAHAAFSNTGKDKATTFEQRFATGYRQIDHSLRHILSEIERLGLLENTIVVVYGDHGDELWTHGFNAGYTHGTLPYAGLCHVPFFIHAPGITPGETDMLACTDDIVDTIFPFAVPDPIHANALQATPFSGINLFAHTREYVFSNNLFPLQKDLSDPERGLTKGYSVTDGIYRLVVSSGGGDPGQGGMELFCDSLDPLNNCNLLHFFTWDDEGEIKEFTLPEGARAKHLAALVAGGAEHEIRSAFTKLKPVLMDNVKKREEHGLKYFSGDKNDIQVMPDFAFKKVRPFRPKVFR